jgi:hypothetical protein
MASRRSRIFELAARIHEGRRHHIAAAEEHHDDPDELFKSAIDLNFRTPGGNRRGRRRRPKAQTDAIARNSSGDPAGLQTGVFISSMLRNFLTGTSNLPRP